MISQPGSTGQPLKRRVNLCTAFIISMGLLLVPKLSAQVWVEQGPGPTTDGQVEGITNNPVTGAINGLAVHPTNPNIAYAATVNGGVWKTTNATSLSPTWTPLTDQQFPAQSINSIAISPVDSNIIWAGTGSTSSDGFDGNPGFGIGRSTDAGATWTLLATATFAGKRVGSIVPTTLVGGNVVLAGTLFDGVSGGVWRSTDGGVTFALRSGAGGSGLPVGGVSSIVADPSNPNLFYAAVPSNFGAGASAGVYVTTDGGVTWAIASTGMTGLTNSYRILLSVHNSAGSNVVYSAVIGTTRKLTGVFRTVNQGGLWTSMGLPSPDIFPGTQGSVHGAIVAHRTDPDIVFLSGDRQALPNPNGCANFTANTFRGIASLGAWSNIVCDGANGSSPHADSRCMVMDSNGSILAGNDGGIYRLISPDVPASRIWISANGSVRPTEMHSVAYDPLSQVVFGGTQDTGTTIQSSPGNLTWIERLQGDGAVVAVDADQVAHPGSSIRYTSFQNLGFWNRSTWNSANVPAGGGTALGLLISSGSGTGLTLSTFDPNIQFYTPYVLNAINPSRMLIGTASIYESFDKGDHLANLGFTGFFISSLSYGSRLNGVLKPDVFYVGVFGTNRIIHRVNVGDPLVSLAFPGGPVRDLVMDPQNYQKIYAVDTSGRVYGSTTEGASWVNLTANLPALCSDPRTVELYSPDPGVRNTVLLVGGMGGMFQMRRPGAAGATWTPYGTGLPRALVMDCHYEYNNDVLVASILGRGAWIVTGAFRGFVASAPPPPLTPGGIRGGSGVDSTSPPPPPPAEIRPGGN
jgi:hypothetical protein